jgi:hypothetical protein
MHKSPPFFIPAPEKLCTFHVIANLFSVNMLTGMFSSFSAKPPPRRASSSIPPDFTTLTVIDEHSGSDVDLGKVLLRHVQREERKTPNKWSSTLPLALGILTFIGLIVVVAVVMSGHGKKLTDSPSSSGGDQSPGKFVPFSISAELNSGVGTFWGESNSLLMTWDILRR